jgi:hypothetical protein
VTVVLSEPTRPTQNSYGARLLRNEFCSVLSGQLLFQLALSGQNRVSKYHSKHELAIGRSLIAN